MENKINRKKRIKRPWPTKEAMEQVYAKKLWGGQTFDFYSGEGSHLPEIIAPYINVVVSFLEPFEKPLAICDLGCGDFNVGKELVPYAKNYVAADIVPELVERNKEMFKATSVQFYCLDLANDELPKGDCAILRQVLQHLSNDEIKRIIPKLDRFKYVILTEHLPEGYFTPNKDIISGQGIRLKKQSGVNLMGAPFHMKVKKEKQLLSTHLPNGKGRIVTMLYEM